MANTLYKLWQAEIKRAGEEFDKLVEARLSSEKNVQSTEKPEKPTKH